MADHLILDRDSREALFQTYAALAARRAAYDTMMWQVPALAVAAQAFLLTIVLGAAVSPTARTLSASMAAVLALMAAQLLGKHRALEVVDCKMMERVEELLGVDLLLGVAPHAKGHLRFEWSASRHPWWVRGSSVRLWIIGLSALAVIDVVALIVGITAPRLIAG